VLADVVRQAAVRYGDRPLYVAPDETVLTYAALDQGSDAVAGALSRLGVGIGDVVALLVPSGPAYAIVYAASAKLGAATAGVNDRLTPLERRRCLDVARPRLVVATATLAEDTELGTCSAVGEIVELSELLRAAEGPANTDLPELDADPERPVAVVFTSGTTGDAKAAVFTEAQLDAISQVDGAMRWDGGGRSLASTSFSHLGYMTKLPQVIRGGGTSFLMDRWSAGRALEMVERHRITVLGGIPTQVALMLRNEHFATTDVSSVRMIALGGGPATGALVREARERFGAPVVVRYTCTEAGVGVGTAVDDPPEDAEQTVGRARAGVELSIRDAGDRSLADGETGQVCLRSAAVMARYHLDPEATAAVFTADGAVRTGDLGWVDDRGRLHLAGRIKEMYVRGGYNVHPQEVEGVLAGHPGISHVVVVGRPDQVMGEIGVAVVVARDPHRPPTLEELRSYAAGTLASYKLPEALVITDELPRTAMEKVDRRALSAVVNKG